MMREISFSFDVTQETEARIRAGGLLVVPLTEAEVVEVRGNIIGVHDFLQMLRRHLATLKEVLETKGSHEPEIRKTLELWSGPAASADHLMDRVRVLLGDAALLSPSQSEQPKGRLQ